MMEPLQADTVIYETKLRRTRLRIINGDLSAARSDVIVSSDDSHLQGKQRIAGSILDRAGEGVRYELEKHRLGQNRLGDVVATSGGGLVCRTILHAVVFDCDEELYADAKTIMAITRKCLGYAEETKALSLSLPVLGEDMASRILSFSDSIHAMLKAIGRWCHEQRRLDPAAIAVYGFDPMALEDVDFGRLLKLALEE